MADEIKLDVEIRLSHDESGKDHANYELVDKELAKYAGDVPVHIDTATNTRLKKLIDRRILVVMIITYFLQSLDKGALGFASIMGIREDTNLQGPQYSWLTTIIYLVILTVEYPENLIIQRAPIAKWLGINVILWGVTVTLTAACHNFAGLITVRAFLGAFEAVCQPTFTVLSAMWYRREEQSKTVVLWYMMNGLQQIFGGLIAFIFTHVPSSSPVKDWQALFMTHGIIAVIWGIFIIWWMPDSPMKAKCFSEEDKKLMVERVRDNRTGVQNKRFRIEQVKDAFTDPQVYAFILIQILTTLPSGGMGAYAAIVVSSFGYSTWKTQLLQMVTGVVQVVSMLTGVWIERKYNSTIWPSVASVMPTIAGAAAMCATPFTPNKRVGLLIAWYCMYSFWAGVGLALSLITRNTGGQTKKSVVVSLTFIAWSTGNSIGPQVFRDQNAPRYFPAFAVILTSFVALEAVLVALRYYYVWQNKIKDGKIARGEAIADVDGIHGFEDITDRENVNFRYAY
ncbi:MFS transporter [Pseudomassariella vexata]|uniref:MFS transporter n=1 Tax=Pseudomassariella vexata TaxID=1141098 RepID=A0A1Y2ECB9_9PEZI|nr:MFS transporter [Pseudomassariella vexata]ORY69047.1 MFS transporter [Pseudomassariella vexata]